MTVLRKLYALWMKFAMALGWFNTRVLLFLFFVIVLGPISVLGRLFGKNFFEDHPRDAQSYWHLRPEPGYTKESCQRQF